MCDRFGLSCSYCKQGALHPSPQELDLSNKDLDGTKTKAREQKNSLIGFNGPEPQTIIDQTTDIDEVAFSKLQIGWSDSREEPKNVMKSLIPPPQVTGNINGEELSQAEKRLQKEEEKYDLHRRVYVGQLSEEEKSYMDTDSLTYIYFA